MDRETAINQVMASHTLPRNIAEAVVDNAGNIDDGKLKIALAGVGWGRSPVSSAAPGLVKALEDAYWQAMDRKDMASCICLKDRIFKLGGHLEARKV